jgi:hydroxymethylpyrimidine pyrophosphatase-like HAD family hydrolase/adenine/guanine phosphoribosyltransferase-like PRPP-binding protein
MNAGAEEAFLPESPQWQYYSRYAWCLSPALPIRELRAHLHEEWQRRDHGRETWQRDEARINLYLLLSGLHCTAADYLASRPFSLSALTRRLSSAQSLGPFLRALVNVPYTLATRRQRRAVEQWNQRVQGCLDAICRILLDEARFGSQNWRVLEENLPFAVQGDLPKRVLTWRMRIPEAYRCQDLTHADAFRLGELLAQREDLRVRPTVILGPRTAGAYFAPLLAAYLSAQNLPTLGWLSIRPKDGLTGTERRRLSQALKAGGRIIVIDDHPNSGDTFVLILRILRALGAEPEDMMFLAPQHPAETDWTSRVRPVETIRLPLRESYKWRLLGDDQRLLAIARQFQIARQWKDAEIIKSSEVDEVNRALEAQFGHTFQTRLKRLIELRVSDVGGKQHVVRLLFKSVGWGWLGYHAYLAGASLTDHVPQLIGLREGLLAIEWVGPLDPALPAAPLEAIQERIPRYLTQRTKTLRLPEDPWMAPPGYRAAGWDRVLRSLRRPLGSIGGRLAAPALRRELRAYEAPLPTLVDGKMRRENWVATASYAVKCDFEHHNFGGGEQDFVDSAFDLAGAFFEMDVSASDEDRMIEIYVRETGDEGVRTRLPIYKLQVGQEAMADACYYLDRPISEPRRASENLRYLAGRNYLTYQFNRHHSARIGRPTEVGWSGRLFFLDLDGVFDTQALGGFPHTTTQGLMALSLLRRHGFSIVPNTGRSVEHVRNYCDEYAFPGGVAEFGCVLVDRARGCEITLAEPEALKELAHFRAVLGKQKGVLLDPGYKVAVHTYRLENGAMLGPAKRDLETILLTEGLKSLEVFVTEADGYVLPKGPGKKRGMEAVLTRLDCKLNLVAAMGDSDTDIDMLQSADIAYVPTNCSPALRMLARSSRNVRLIRASNQRALLSAVVDLIERRQGEKLDRRSRSDVRRSDHLIDRVLDLVDEPEMQRWLRIARARFVGGRLPGWEPSQ